MLGVEVSGAADGRTEGGLAPPIVFECGFNNDSTRHTLSHNYSLMMKGFIMPEDAINKVPYQKGTVALSLIVLIYCYGQGELNQSLTIALVGLRLNNPQILEIVVLASLVWHMLRFYITGEWSVRSFTQKTSTYLIAINPTRPNWPVIESSPNAPLSALELKEHKRTYIRDTQVTGLFSSKVKLSFEDSTARDGMEYFILKVPLLLRLKAEVVSLVRWIFKSDQFAYRYLPMAVAIAAVARAASEVAFVA